MRGAKEVLVGVVFATALTPIGGALAAPHPGTAVLAGQVSLGCQPFEQKVLQITNTSNFTISGGTRISYDVERMPDHQHITGYLIPSSFAPGAVLKKGLFPIFSCTAWFRMPLLLAPAR